MARARRKYEAIVVAHTHWDREWYATFEQYRIRLVRMVDRVLAVLESRPEFHYFTLDGQTIVLEDYLAIRPENEPRLRAAVQSGRLLIGPWYVLPDEFLVSGEALIRNLLLGRKVASRFGPAMEVGYVPDPFGHVAQLPQILAGFGVDSIIFSRGLGDEGESLRDTFRWEAPDGTSVLAVHQIGWAERNTGYLNASALGYQNPWMARTCPPDLHLAIDQLRSLCATLSRYANTRYLLINNGADHLEPQAELPEMLDRANAELGEVRLVQGTFPQLVTRVKSESPTLKTWRGELRGSRYAPILAGVFSARMHLKQENARTQKLLERWAEPFSAIAWLEGATYPAAFLWQAWRYLISNHPHDSICGCSVDQVHAEMLPRFAGAQQIAEQVTTEALAKLTGNVDLGWLPEGGLPLAVFNPLGWAWEGVMSVTADLPDQLVQAPALEAVTEAGERRPCQVLQRWRCQPVQGKDSPVLDRAQIVFRASAPPIGYRVYGLVADKVRPAGSAASSEKVIENEHHRVAADPNGGFEITHKPSGHTIRGALRLVDEADAGDEYTFAPVAGDVPVTTKAARTTTRRVANGPVLSILQVESELELPKALAADRQSRAGETVACPVRMRVSLAEGSDRIDVDIDVENRAEDHRLRLVVPTGIGADTVTAGGHFALVRRPIAPSRPEGWAERPPGANHHDGFVAVGKGERSVTMIADGLPEYEAIPGEDGVTLALTLLRCVGWLSRDDIASRPGHAGPGFATPGAQCRGNYSFRCGLMIGSGQGALQSYRRATERNVLPRVVVLGPSAGGGELDTHPSVRGYLSLEGDGLALSAVKRSEDGCWLVVRVVNLGEEAARGRLRCHRAIAEAVSLRLDETVNETLISEADGSLEFEAPRGKIVTLGLSGGFTRKGHSQ